MKQAALQTAVFTALSGDAPLIGLLSTAWAPHTPVFARVPQVHAEKDEYFPYIRFHCTSERENGAKDMTGGNAIVQVSAFSRDNSEIEVKQILDRVHTVLHGQGLTISGANHIATYRESIQIADDPDGETIHGSALFRVTYFDN